MNSPLIEIPPKLREALPPGEDGASAPPKYDPEKLRDKVIDACGTLAVDALVPEKLMLEPPQTREWVKAAMDRLDVRLLGLMIARARENIWNWNDQAAVMMVHWLAQCAGVRVAFNALVHASRWTRERSGPDVHLEHDAPLREDWTALGAKPWESMWQFRGYWMRGRAEDRAFCIRELDHAWDRLPLAARVTFGIVLPETRIRAAEFHRSLSAEQAEWTDPWLRWAAGESLDRVTRGGAMLKQDLRLVATLVTSQGDRTLPFLLDAATQGHDSPVAWGLAAFNAPLAAEALARLAARHVTNLKALEWASQTRPESTFQAVVCVLQESGLSRAGALRLEAATKSLARRLGERLPNLIEALSGPVRAKIKNLLRTTVGPESAEAPPSQWPDVLSSPPWARSAPKEVDGEQFELAVLDVLPEEDWNGEDRRRWESRDRPPYFQTRLAAAAEFADLLKGWTSEDILALDRQSGELLRFISEWQATYGAIAMDVRERCVQVVVHCGWFLPEAAALAFWNAIGSEMVTPRAGGFVARFGLRALPGLLRVLAHDLDEHFVAKHIGAAEVAPFVARALARKPTRRTDALWWLSRFPLHAAAGLLPAALGRVPGVRREARAALRALAGLGQGAALLTIAQRYEDSGVLRAAQAFVAQDPIQEFPPRIGARKLPDFWKTSLWRRPVLRVNSLNLPDKALHPLGLMLSFAVDMPRGYAGLEAVKAACEPDSLADFGWDLAEAWEAAGAARVNNWALRALALIGNEETARRLGGLIRRWSAPAARNASARIEWALETLMHLQTDAALLQLDLIANKNRRAVVRQCAAQKLTVAATERGMSQEELEDRLVPDLGLDTRGCLTLDFGARQFDVTLDDALVPVVRESIRGVAGRRLYTLPRPRVGDDVVLAKDASIRFKGLKEDAGAVAARQPRRLERAMCSGRSWPLASFKTFIADHPVMRNLAQRLVWGVKGRGIDVRGIPHLDCLFRLSAEGEWLQIDDAVLEVPDGDSTAIALAHPLQMSEAQIRAFEGCFLDFELLQPFDQLRRATYQLEDSERMSQALRRWENRKAQPGPLWALEGKGWHREISDGIFHTAWRNLRGSGRVALRINPGLPCDGSVKAQTLGVLSSSVPFQAISPIDFSEIVRDVEELISR